MKKRFIAIILIFTLLLSITCKANDQSGTDTVTEHYIRVNYAGTNVEKMVIQDGEGKYYAPISWLEYFGLMKHKEDNEYFMFYYADQEKDATFAKRILIDKQGKTLDIRYYESNYSWFHEMSAYYDWIERSTGNFTEFSIQKLAQEYGVTIREIEEGNSFVNNSFSIFSSEFSDQIIYNDELYLPICELLPLINAQITICDDGGLYIRPNCMSLSQALYDVDIGLLIFDADNDIACEGFVSKSSYILNTIFDLRFDRLDFVNNSGTVADYEHIFKALLADNQAYLSIYDGEVTPTEQATDRLSEFLTESDTVWKQLDVSQNIFEAMGVAKDLYPELKLLYGNNSVTMPATGYALDGAIKLLDYYNAYQNQIDDHRMMLSAVYDYDAKENSPARQAAQNIQALYGNDVANQFMSATTIAFREILIQEVPKGIVQKAMLPFTAANELTKLATPDSFETIQNFALIYAMDAASQKAYDVYMSRKYSKDYDAEALNQLRLSVMMALISSRYAYSTVWDDSYEKIEEIDAVLQKIYLAADGVECDSSDYYLKKLKELKSLVRKLRCVCHEEDGTFVRVGESVIRKAKYIAGVSNGYAWVLENNQYTLCDENGMILGYMEEEYTPYAKTNSCGYTLVQGNTLAIADSKGVIVASEESLNVQFVIPEINQHQDWYEREIPGFEDGYLLTYSMEETYNGVTYKIGILGTDGQWIVNPSADHPILKTAFKASKSEITEKIFYSSDGIYSFYTAWNIASFYDAKQNKVTGSVNLLDVDVSIEDFNFESGRALWKTVYVYDTGYFCLTPDGNVSVFLETDGSHSIFENGKTYLLSGKYFYVDDVLYSRETLSALPDGTNQLYYDCEYINGLRPKLIENSEGTTYFGVENAGGFLFEPVKVPFSFYSASSSYDGQYALFKTSYVVYIYDYSGNLINDYEIGLYASAKISNGVVRVSSSYSDTYVYVHEIPEQ